MPFLMAASVIPLPILGLGLLGTWNAGLALGRILFVADARGELPEVTPRERLLALVLLQAAFAISIVAFSDVPKYGGEKLFMPFFPLFALLAAEGFRALLGALGDIAFLHLPSTVQAAVPDLPAQSTVQGNDDARIPLQNRSALAVAVALGILLIIPGAVGQARYWGGFALSYYAGGIGGLSGATARGYERTYYDIADKQLARWLDENLKPEETVHFEPNHKEYERTYKWLRKDGVVRRNLKLTKNAHQASIIVLTHERRWAQYPQLFNKYRNLKVLHQKSRVGVPLYTVYRHR
jgi:hypothetical protein